MIKKSLYILALLVQLTPALAQYRHEAFNSASPPPLPKKIVVIPAEVRVQELAVGGVLTKLPDLTEQASANLSRSSRTFLTEKKSLEAIDVPNGLSADEKEQLEDYLATFYMVGLSAFNTTRAGGSAWQHKRENFDYSLGQGLSFLREKTGADAALMIVGEDIVSSGGRKTAAFLGALAGVIVPLGNSVVFVCMLDLKTGDLQWIHSTSSGVKDLSNPDSANTMITEMLSSYPLAKK